jgi:hypothetical protein
MRRQCVERDLAMIDLVEGDVDAAAVRYERGLACYEDGG